MNCPKTQISLKKKILFIFFSIIIFLVLLEIGLRTSSYSYLKIARPSSTKPIFQNQEEGFTILCLGDSFTFGLGAKKGYPGYLEHLLKERIVNRKIKIYNLGRLGSNSSMLLKALPQNIAKYNANLIIVMTGCNNTWVSTDSNYYIIHGNIFRKFDVFLSNLRVYKLFKIIFINLKQIKSIIMSKLGYTESNTSVRDTGTHEQVGNQKNLMLMIKKYNKSLKIDPHNIESLSMLGRIYREIGKEELAVKNCKKALEINQNLYDVHKQLASAYISMGKYELAKEHLRKAATGGVDCGLIAELMKQTCRNMQECFEEINILKDIVKRKCIDKTERRKAIRELDFIINVAKNKKELDKVLFYDLSEIIKIAKENNVNIVLQVYPHDFSIAEVIKKVSEKYSVPLVDNDLIFQKILEMHKKEEFFVSDGHCNSKGYQIIAENVYDVLVASKLLDKEAQ